MVYVSRSLVRPFQTAPRVAFRAVRQCPSPNRSAIHDQVIVVSVRRRIAIRTFLGSPLRRRPNSDSVQPALRSIVPILFFSQTFPCHLKDFCSHTSSAAFVPHPSFVSSLIEIVASRSGSKHFRRVTHGRDSIENGQSLFPPTLPANLFEKESSEERVRLRHFPGCGHARLQGETIRGQKSGGGHLSSQHNWMAR